MRRRDFLKGAGVGAAAVAAGRVFAARPADGGSKRPNILWICAEDMSAHVGCYGEKTIRTPNIDRLAAEGALFKRAFVTCPVCSPSRSAMITGMHQTTIGAHNHRSSRAAVKIRLPKHVKLIPEYFQQAGYYTSNGYLRRAPKRRKRGGGPGKTDYNFVWNRSVYDGSDWSGRKPGQPFFAQIQLRGGKNRGAKVPNPVDPAKVKLPPYYPDHPVLREDWARYLNSVINTDREVGQILERLKSEGILDSTVVFFWTDHGISHVRDKQFLYEGGIHVPLIVRAPGVKAGTVKEDLVLQTDIATESLRMAGIQVPKHLEGRPLFGPNAAKREYIVAARDRCDETVERIRCVRTRRFKYIRNFHSNRPHAQPNRYKDGKAIMKTMRRLFAEGKLTKAQARVFRPTRPVEELYDLQADPYELKNLAKSRGHVGTLRTLRRVLREWMRQSGDCGQIPEAELAELSRKHGSPYAALRQKEVRQVCDRLAKLADLQDAGPAAIGKLVAAMKDPAASVRYEAAMALGHLGRRAKSAAKVLADAMKDRSASVRVAAARAFCRIGVLKEGVLPAVLLAELKNDNEIVRHYTALVLEEIGEKARGALPNLKAAKSDKYDYVRRVATRAVNKLKRDPETTTTRT